MRLAHTLSRYAIVGIVCVALNNVILIAGEAIGIHYAWSAVFCLIAVGGLAYLAHVHFTFRASRSWMGYVRFLGTQGASLALTLLALFLLCDVAGLPVWGAAPITSVMLFAVQFLSTRWAVVTRHA